MIKAIINMIGLLLFIMLSIKLSLLVSELVVLLTFLEMAECCYFPH